RIVEGTLERQARRSRPRLRDSGGRRAGVRLAIGARAEGSALPGLRCVALGFAEGPLRCSLREGGCDASAWPLNAATHRNFSPVRRKDAGLPLAALRSSPTQRRPGRALPSAL